MLTLTRPHSGRVISGVAIGMAELYGAPVWTVRLVFATALLASPIIVLVYLLLAICIPDKERLAGGQRLTSSETDVVPRERSERFSQLLIRRLLGKRTQHVIPVQFLAIALLVFAALLELPRVEGDSFYLAHPVVTAIFGYVSRIGTAIFYSSIACLFLAGSKKIETVEIPPTQLQKKFSLDRSDGKMIAGNASGLSRVIGIEPAYFRALLILLNILTVGFVGVVYFAVWYFYRRNAAGDEAMVMPPAPETKHAFRSNEGFRIGMAILLLLLGVIRLSTEFRFFFFNEGFFQGIVMMLAGMGLVWRGCTARMERKPEWLLAGSTIFFIGVYLLASALGRIQLTLGQRFEVAELVAALSIAYFGIIALRGHARRIAFGLAILFGMSAALIVVHVAPPRYLATLVQFYDFFYPLIFAGLGLWIAFER